MVPSPALAGPTGPGIKAMSSSLLSRHNPARERIFTALLAEPLRDWTVAELAASVPAVSAEAARTTLYLLLNNLVVKQSPGQRRLTFHLTADGAEILRGLIDQWQARYPSRQVSP
jgi:hypothetical protein